MSLSGNPIGRKPHRLRREAGDVRLAGGQPRSRALGDVTARLHAWSAGDTAARGQFLTVVYQGRPGGEVNRAKNSQLHREVAIRVLPELFPLEPDPDRVAHVEREAQILASPN